MRSRLGMHCASRASPCARGPKPSKTERGGSGVHQASGSRALRDSTDQRDWCHLSERNPTQTRRAVFAPWADSLFRAVVTLACLGVLGTPALLMAWVRSPLSTGVGEAATQPIQFDHRHHVRDDGIDCQYCHYDSERSPSAGMPETATCMGCHAQIWKDSPRLEPVRSSYYRNEPIAWQRVYDLPDFVYFNHSMHVKSGVGCETCHGRVDLMAAIEKANTLQMDWCLDCHRHPERFVRPAREITKMGYIPTIPQRELGPRLVASSHIRPPTDCTGCHR